MSTKLASKANERQAKKRASRDVPKAGQGGRPSGRRTRKPSTDSNLLGLVAYKSYLHSAEHEHVATQMRNMHKSLTPEEKLKALVNRVKERASTKNWNESYTDLVGKTLVALVRDMELPVGEYGAVLCHQEVMWLKQQIKEVMD